MISRCLATPLEHSVRQYFFLSSKSFLMRGSLLRVVYCSPKTCGRDSREQIVCQIPSSWQHHLFVNFLSWFYQLRSAWFGLGPLKSSRWFWAIAFFPLTSFGTTVAVGNRVGNNFFLCASCFALLYEVLDACSIDYILGVDIGTLCCYIIKQSVVPKHEGRTALHRLGRGLTRSDVLLAKMSPKPTVEKTVKTK